MSMTPRRNDSSSSDILPAGSSVSAHIGVRRSRQDPSIQVSMSTPFSFRRPATRVARSASLGHPSTLTPVYPLARPPVRPLVRPNAHPPTLPLDRPASSSLHDAHQSLNHQPITTWDPLPRAPSALLPARRPPGRPCRPGPPVRPPTTRPRC